VEDLSEEEWSAAVTSRAEALTTAVLMPTAVNCRIQRTQTTHREEHRGLPGSTCELLG
jgi:hypothetical protein